MTAAHGQDRIVVGAKFLILKFSWRIRGLPYVQWFQQHDVVFILYP
jgi:hypothetical protein